MKKTVCPRALCHCKIMGWTGMLSAKWCICLWITKLKTSPHLIWMCQLQTYLYDSPSYITCSIALWESIKTAVTIQSYFWFKYFWWFHVFVSFRLQTFKGPSLPVEMTGFLYILFQTTPRLKFLQRRSCLHTQQIRGISIPHFFQIQPTISGVFGCVKWEEEQQFNNMYGERLKQKDKIPQKQPMLKLRSFIYKGTQQPAFLILVP